MLLKRENAQCLNGWHTEWLEAISWVDRYSFGCLLKRWWLATASLVKIARQWHGVVVRHVANCWWRLLFQAVLKHSAKSIDCLLLLRPQSSFLHWQQFRCHIFLKALSMLLHTCQTPYENVAPSETVLFVMLLKNRWGLFSFYVIVLCDLKKKKTGNLLGNTRIASSECKICHISFGFSNWEVVG